MRSNKCKFETVLQAGHHAISLLYVHGRAGGAFTTSTKLPANPLFSQLTAAYVIHALSLSEPCGAVRIAEVEAAQLLLDPAQVDGQTHAALQAAQLADAV